MQLAEQDEIGWCNSTETLIEMGVLKSGLVFLVATVSLYPVFVVLLTVPWLQRQ